MICSIILYWKHCEAMTDSVHSTIIEWVVLEHDEVF
jgi:hypothetical protein